jgi:signal transduction histidine kinase
LEVNQKLKKTLRELDKFVYNASHDLSAPLKSILGLVHIARLEKDKNHLNEHFDYIEKSINKQERVINDLIRYSRNSKNEVSVKNINLSKLVDEALSELKYYPGFDEVKIFKKLKLDCVLTDESRLQVVLNNLLSNAIKYRDRDKNICEIIISSSTENGQWVLEIEDNGQGIGIGESKKIFDMFYRANECSDGSGLGLFIVAETVEKMNGTIEVKSQLSKGSIFTLRFHN